MGKPSRGSWSFVRGVLGIVLLLALALTPASAHPDAVASSSNAFAPHGNTGSLMFIENAGQWPVDARYQVWGSPLGVGTTWLADDAIWISIVERADDETPDRWNVEAFERSNVQPADGQGVNLKLTFPGANPDVRIEPFDPLDTTVSYFIGNDPDEWHPDVPVYGGVRYVDLYPGVDLVLGESDAFWRLDAQLGGDIGPVLLHVEGAEGATRVGDNLRLATAAGDLDLKLPPSALSLQMEVTTAEAMPVVFNLPSRGVQTSPLAPLDDPTDLLYSTFLGGSRGDEGNAIAVDAADSAYVTGETESSDFPTTPGAFDPSLGGYDAFVAKLNPSGSGLGYATFLGGSYSDWGSGIAVDGAGNAYVTGGTGSSDFPTTPDAFDTTHNEGNDVFVSKLSTDGATLEYSTFVGGAENELGVEISLDHSGKVLIAGNTRSTDFPTTPGAFDRTQNGDLDIFVTRFNETGSALDYSTFIGGSNLDGCGVMALDESGAPYIAGTTSSPNFPVTPGALDPSHNDPPGRDAYVARLNVAGSEVDVATFLGGTDGDWATDLALDANGRAYVVGYTGSRNFPTTTGTLSPTYVGGLRDAYVVLLDGSLSTMVFGTFLGGSSSDWSTAISVDDSGLVSVAGYTQSADFPVSAGAYDATYNGATDGWIAQLNSVGTHVRYGTYLGGSSDDRIYDIELLNTSHAFVAGDTLSSDYPTTPDAFDTSYSGGDAFVAKLQLETRQLHASMTSYAPDIDGDLGEWPPIESTTLNVSTASRIIGSFSGDADAEMTCRAMWDNANLYLGCQVTDDVIVVDSGVRFWHDDAVELVFDGKHDGVSFCGDDPCPDDHKYELSADGLLQDYQRPPAYGVRAAVQQRSGGYDVEMAIPQSEFDTVPFQPYTVILGFNLSLLDDDDGGSMEGQLVWSGEYTQGHAWTYGDLRFWPDHGYPPPTGTPTATPTATATATPTPTATSTPECQDPFEPDDQWTQAKLLPLDGSGQLRSFHQPGDVDYAKFVAGAGQVLTLRTDQLAAGVDTTLTLYDTDGVTQLAYNDDDLLNAPASRIEWTVPDTGTYFLKAAHLDGQAGGCGMTYELYGELEQPMPQPGHIWLPLITK